MGATCKKLPPKGVIISEANGRWYDIFSGIAPELTVAAANVGRHYVCPVTAHSKKNSKDFRLYPGFHETGGGICTCMSDEERRQAAHGFGLLAWRNGYSLDDAFNEVAKFLGLEYEQNRVVQTKKRLDRVPVPTETEEEKALRLKNRMNYLNKLWLESFEIHHPKAHPLREYIAYRGLDVGIIPPTIRCHPGVKVKVGDETVGPFPMMLSMVHNKEMVPVALHRTYLDVDGCGKAPIEMPKRSLGRDDNSARGAAIHLTHLTSAIETLHLAEGIETALAIAASTGGHVWSVISTSFMELVEIPSHIKNVVIWADKDRPNARTNLCPGAEAAGNLAARLRQEGKRVNVLYPQADIPDGQTGIDWLDVYNQLLQEEPAVKKPNLKLVAA